MLLMVAHSTVRQANKWMANNNKNNKKKRTKLNIVTAILCASRSSPEKYVNILRQMTFSDREGENGMVAGGWSGTAGKWFFFHLVETCLALMAEGGSEETGAIA